MSRVGEQDDAREQGVVTFGEGLQGQLGHKAPKHGEGAAPSDQSWPFVFWILTERVEARNGAVPLHAVLCLQGSWARLGRKRHVLSANLYDARRAAVGRARLVEGLGGKEWDEQTGTTRSLYPVQVTRVAAREGGVWRDSEPVHTRRAREGGVWKGPMTGQSMSRIAPCVGVSSASGAACIASAA